MNLFKKINNFINWLEKPRFNFFIIFWLVIGIGIVRAYLEDACIRKQFSIFYFNENDIMTSLAAFFGGTFALSLFVKQKPLKIWNASILFWPIFFSPPLIDWLFFNGCSVIGYEFINLKKVDWSILFPPLYLYKIGVSPGLVFEYTAIFLAMIYVYFKTSSLKRTLGFYLLLNLPGYILILSPLPFLTQFELIWQLRALPFAYEWYYFLFVCISILTVLKNRIKIPKKILTLSIPALIFYLIGFFSVSQPPKPFSQLLKISVTFLPLIAFFVLKKSKDVGFTLLTFSFFLSLFTKNVWLSILSLASIPLVLKGYEKENKLVLALLLTFFFFAGHFYYGTSKILTQNLFLSLPIFLLSYTMLKVFKRW